MTVLPLPETPPFTLQEVLGEFLDRVRLATSLDAVNIAAGIAGEEMARLTA